MGSGGKMGRMSEEKTNADGNTGDVTDCPQRLLLEEKLAKIFDF